MFPLQLIQEEGLGRDILENQSVPIKMPLKTEHVRGIITIQEENTEEEKAKN